MIYPWLVYVHVGSVLVFMLAHGASASIAFRLRKERDLTRIGAILDLSAHSYIAMSLSIIVILASGIVLGILGDWWRFGWFWASLVLLLAISGLMTPLTAIPYNKVRNALGLKMPPFVKRLPGPEGPPSPEEVRQMLDKAHPEASAVIGLIGILVILWLMTFKPF